MASVMQSIDLDKEWARKADELVDARLGWELIRQLFPSVTMPVEVGQRVETKVMVVVRTVDWSSLAVQP